MKTNVLHRILVGASLILFLLGLVSWAGPAMAGENGLFVKKEAWVKGDDIYLKDIAQVNGLTKLAGKLMNMRVARAPRPSKYKVIRGAWIKARVEKLGLPKGATVEIPSRIKVHRLFQKVDKKQLKELFVEYVKSRLEPGSFEVSRFQVSGNTPVPEGLLDVEVQGSSSDDCYGQVKVAAHVAVDGVAINRVRISAWVDYFAPVVLAARDLDRFTVLTTEDFTVERRNISRLAEGAVINPDDAEGMRIRQRARQGRVLEHRMLENPPLVNKGDDVTIVARRDRLTITTLGLAKSSGGMGDRISVENIMSKKLISCRVSGPAMVEVRF